MEPSTEYKKETGVFALARLVERIQSSLDPTSLARCSRANRTFYTSALLAWCATPADRCWIALPSRRALESFVKWCKNIPRCIYADIRISKFELHHWMDKVPAGLNDKMNAIYRIRNEVLSTLGKIDVFYVNTDEIDVAQMECVNQIRWEEPVSDWIPAVDDWVVEGTAMQTFRGIGVKNTNVTNERKVEKQLQKKEQRAMKRAAKGGR